MVATESVVSLLVIFALSLLIVRIGSIALRMTGLSPDIASFQSTSAFSGAGYTTEEAEQTVATPERRKIIKALIRLGSVGLVSVIASLVLSFTDAQGGNAFNLVYILTGVILLVLAARSEWLNRLLTPFIEWSLERTTDLELRDYTEMLGFQQEYRVAEIDVEEDDWLAYETPDSCDLNDEGVLLLGILREGAYIGAPGPDTEIEPGDTVILYGKEDRLMELSERVAGDEAAHQEAIEDHEEELEEQERRTNG
ncbi:TrkA C-terminal domain-containing protein [Natrinema versiforme]|uniref:TrkA-C domain protein n=1 Tax=Natrinema versiforme TaxID=88724 RepID=A0A4P8WQH5_9EURY|nr:TrkA C-terminal domain-containing protein [Natrinema versiforme]QCS44431.1 TrkA-C domain protein [Natrinema versiforme]